ncbi:hypothetical protein BN961_02900 [Afipia felis]|uniref:Uncharacterized protein n=1 Tax=Afipia felis TaxID=1035 RepID=A0A090MUL1_AFIFE|nr:hypothetical protein [Afipia felis]CEG09474.1 hypothetical protein BN961_02900 [Afipia felis]
MSDLAHVDNLVAEQDRGADLAIVHPVTGDKLDVVLTIAGPDSATARRARLQFSDELVAFRHHPPAEEMERIEVERLARLVIAWKATRDGKPVEFNFTNVVRLLNSARFVREQVEAFSQKREAYFLRTF